MRLAVGEMGGKLNGDDDDDDGVTILLVVDDSVVEEMKVDCKGLWNDLE
jgi:hypothetical protein